MCLNNPVVPVNVIPDMAIIVTITEMKIEMYILNIVLYVMAIPQNAQEIYVLRDDECFNW